MSEPSSSDSLAKWAAIFREEGDVETADAIELQLEGAADRSLSEDDAERLEHVLARARACDGIGHYEAASEGYAEALQVVEGALGRCHPQIVEHLSNVARCQLNAGLYEEAMAGHTRLLHLVQDLYGAGVPFAATARYYIRVCQTSLRLANSTMRLQAYMGDMLRHAQGRFDVAAAARADRMRGIALRLVERGRPASAIRLHEAAMALRLRHAEPEEGTALLHLHRHAMDLKDAGEPGRAAAVLTRLIAVRNRKSACTDQGKLLREALTDAAACLSALGQGRSAREARAIADLIARGDGGDCGIAAAGGPSCPNNA